MLRTAVALLALFPVLAFATTLKISTLYPDGTAVVKALKPAGDTSGQETDGRVSLKIYPGGVMGDDRAVQRKIRVGQLHGQMAQGGAFAGAYADSQILNVPLTFNNYAEVDAARAELFRQSSGGPPSRTGSGSFEPRVNTADEIRAKYGKGPGGGGVSELRGNAEEPRNKLLERGEKLSSLQDKTAKMQNDAEDFHAMAQKLAKQNQSWW